MTLLRLPHMLNQNGKKLTKAALQVLLGAVPLLLLRLLLMPEVAAVPPADLLLEPGHPVTNPTANTHSAPTTTSVSITYDEAISATTVSTKTFAVHAMQTGLLAQTYDVNGSTISLTPAQAFKPGELVQVSATTGTLNLSGQGPISPTVWQFWTTAGGRGGVFVDGPDLSGNDSTQDLAVGDLGGDGDLDVFVANDGANTVWRNDGSAFANSGQSLGSANSQAVALGDLDGDGDLDAFVANDGANTVWLNDGTDTFSDSGQRLGSANSTAVALGDLDGDGDLDALVGNDGQNDEVWINEGTGHFTGSGQAMVNRLSKDVALGDLDGDGDLDAFASTGIPDNDKVWLNNGNGFFTSNQTFAESNSSGVALGDVDGDGDLDALVGNFDFDGANHVWLNDGHGTFADSGQGLGISKTSDVAFGDMDGDGDLDAFIGNDRGQSNTIWLNNRAGIFALSQRLGNSNGQAVVLGDIEGDGDVDALDANYNQPNEVWLNVPPEVRINQIVPNPSYFGEIVEFNGSGTRDAITEMLEEYEWTLLSITETCGAQPDPFMLGDSARLLINSIAVGEHRVCLRARHRHSIWSDYDTMSMIITMTVLEDRWMQSDIAVGREGISFWEDESAAIPASGPSVGDLVYVKVRVDNIGFQDTPDSVTVSLYDGDIVPENWVTSDTIEQIAAGSAEFVVLPWTVAGEEGYRVLSVDIEYTENIPYFRTYPWPPWEEPHIESTYDNNQATAFIVVGPPIVGTYAISVTADIVPLTGDPELYAGYHANFFGDAHYNWGSQIPVMGAETSIEIQGAGGYSDVYNTWTTAPSGHYVYHIQLPPAPGTYTAAVTVSDNNLIGATVITFTVESAEDLPDLYVQRFSVGLSGPSVYHREWHTYPPHRVYHHSGLYGVRDEPIVISAKVVNRGNLDAGPFKVSFYHGNPYGSGTLLGKTRVSELALGTSTTVTYDWTPTETSTCTIQVVVDKEDKVRESNEINNYDAYYYRYQGYFNRQVHRDIIGIRARNPDLRATDLVYVEPNVGQAVTMTTTVENIGHDRIGCRDGFNVTIYDGYPGVSDTVMLTETRIVGPMRPNTYRTIHDIVWDTSREGFVPGQHHICVTVDTGEEIDEEFEENNVNCWDPYVYPKEADLWPVGLSFSPKAPRPGTTITLTATIENRGADEFTGTQLITFYLNAPSEGNEIDTSTLEGPIAGRGGTGTTSIPWTPSTHGTAYIYVKAPDHLSGVFGVTVYPDPPPDLRIRSGDIRVTPPWPVLGDAVSVTVDIANVGVTTATDFIVRFYTDSPIGGLVQLGSPQTVSSLAPGMTTTIQANATFAATDRYYAIKVEAMPAVGQWDADFGDNEATTSVEVSLPPDLAIFKDIFQHQLRANYADLDYILTVANTWAVTATGSFTVTDIMPSGLNFETIGYYDDRIPSSWRCSHHDLIVTCTYSGSLAPNASTQIHIWGESSVIAPMDAITNCATLTTPNEENPANNTACHVIALGEIAGTVTDADDLRLADIEVTAYGPNDKSYADWTRTDATGHYALPHLEPGAYKVGFSDLSERYHDEYYDNVGNLEDANLVDVITGTTTVINADLDPIITGMVAGTVATADGAKLKGIYAIAYPRDMNEQDYGRSGWGWSSSWLAWARSHREIGTTTADATGEFTLTLPTGSYRLYFFDPSGEWRSQYYDGVDSPGDATVIEVTEDSFVDIDGTLSASDPPIAKVDAGPYPVANLGDGQSGVEVPSTEQNHVILAVTTTLEPCDSGQTLAAELVLVNPGDSEILAGPYPMSPTGNPGEYTGSIPGADLVDGSEVAVKRYCHDEWDGLLVPVAVIVVSTPTGRITDAETGTAISDATVTLYKVPGWWPKETSSDDRPYTCQSHHSKQPDAPWDQPAPVTRGVRASPTLKEFDPLINPQMPNELGYYSWDLAEGCWYVVVEADWYETKVSSVVGVPPEVTNLDLALTPRRIYWPIILKNWSD